MPSSRRGSSDGYNPYSVSKYRTSPVSHGKMLRSRRYDPRFNPNLPTIEFTQYRADIDKSLREAYGDQYGLRESELYLGDLDIARYYETGHSPDQAAADIYELVQSGGEFI